MAKKIFGIARIGSTGAFKVGDISNVEEVKDMVGVFMDHKAGRRNVVMVRLGDEALARVDQLVEATLFGSRSEAAAFLVSAGIEGQKELLDRLSVHTDEIRKLKEQLRKVAMDAIKPVK